MAQHRDVVVLQPGYLPWLGYFDQVATADVFVFYDDVQFDKNGWRNRNRLLGSDGPQWITVPVKLAGNAFAPIRDVETVRPDHWPKKHLATIRTLYGRAPFFDWCYPELERYLLGREYRFVIDLCLEGHAVLTKLLGLATPTRFSSELGHQEGGRTERLVSICKDLGATRYISGAAARSYMEEELWREAGIALAYQDYPHPIHRQWGEAFVSHLSIVDALMFVGPETRAFLGITHSKARP